MQRKNIRQTRVNNEVKRALSSILENDIHDNRISPFTSIMEVNVTQDLKYCRVIISVLGSETDIESTREGLESAKGFIRGRLAKTVNLRNTPELTFVMSDSIDYGVRMSGLIDEVIRNDESNRRD